MHPSIFKSYDIRGVVPDDWEPGDARRIAKALAHVRHPSRVVVGHDARTSSPAILEALIDGFITSGVSVTNVGACSTPMFTFAVGSAEGTYDLGVMVTASHNPAQYNGLKVLSADVLPLGLGSGLEAVRDLALSEQPLIDPPTMGKMEEQHDLLDRYLAHLFQTVTLGALPSTVRIAIDAGNGMVGLTLPKFCKSIPSLEVSKLYWDPDGSFPNHEANPLKRETLKELMETVVRDGCMLGIAFDGDGDRVGFVDENGEPVPGDLMTVILAWAMLRRKMGGDHPTILCDLRSSWSTFESLKRANVHAQPTRVGHAHIKRLMRETGAMFGGELSMHYYFPQMWSGESGELAVLLLLDLMLSTGKSLSHLWKSLATYANSGELNFHSDDAASVLDRIRETYSPHATSVSDMDGVKCEFRSNEHPEGDWWFSARASNTEPLVRLVVEAKSQELLKQKVQELEAIIS